MNPITEFKGEYRWLSNFSRVLTNLDEYTFDDIDTRLLKLFGFNPSTSIEDVTKKTEGTLLGGIFLNVENAYQFMKCPTNSIWFDYCIKETPSKVKTASKLITIRKDWENVKLDIMRFLVIQKFICNPAYTYLLLSTGDEDIIEGNYWNDTYWGKCFKTQQGENHLGKIIMEVREKLIMFAKMQLPNE